MAIPTARVGDLLLPTHAALPNMSSERRRTAGLNRGHHATLATIEVVGIGLAIGLAVATEHIRHLEGRASHARWFSPMVSTPAAARSPAPRASNARAGSSPRR